LRLLCQLQAQIFITFKIGIQASELKGFDTAITEHELLHGSAHRLRWLRHLPHEGQSCYIGHPARDPGALQAVSHQH
jgi:hypothetical protein